MSADNGHGWQKVQLNQLRVDTTAEFMMVSEQLARQLLARQESWKELSRAVEVTDDHGVKHICNHVIKVSVRWETARSTGDEKVYVSSRLRQTNEKTPRAMIDLVMPRDIAAVETRSAPTVQPNYQHVQQTQGT